MRRDPDAIFATRAKSRAIPFDFVLEKLADLDPWTRPMFGSTAVYVDDKIVFALRDGKADGDNGVWVATTREQHASLRKELPSLRSIAVLGIGQTGWQVIPFDADDFETSVLRACALVRARIPGSARSPRRRRRLRPLPRSVLRLNVFERSRNAPRASTSPRPMIAPVARAARHPLFTRSSQPRVDAVTYA